MNQLSYYLRRTTDSLMPCQNTEAERCLQPHDLEDAEVIVLHEQAAKNALINGDHCAIIIESFTEGDDYDFLDRMRDAFLDDDVMELGRITQKLIADYALQVAQANGNA